MREVILNTFPSPSRVAILLPCHNESATVASVVSSFRSAVPEAEIVVFDNQSSDRTAEIAREAGASVRPVDKLGKGNVVQVMFADIEADIYVMVDGDNTYDASVLPSALKMMHDHSLDFVNIARIWKGATYRRGHQLGNRVFQAFVRHLFNHPVGDMLSGYKVFSRRFVKSFPGQPAGFEVEAALTIHALELNVPMGEIEATYFQRAEGGSSKLRTFRDGSRILRAIASLYRHEYPTRVFGGLALVCSIVSVVLGYPIVVTFFQTGLVPRFPTAILCSALMVIAALLASVGLVLDTVTHGHKEHRRLKYLSYPGPFHTRSFHDE
ncbi:MAG: glycosyltransferase family 2 protein [Candidatus Dormibacteria bacterium]